MYEDTPDDIVHDILSKASYENHPLGYPILGTEKTLESFNGDKLRQYMNDMYTPDKVVVSIAGNIDEAFISEVEAYFGNYSGNQTNQDLQKPSFHTNKITRKKKPNKPISA